jgi:hypothetical protein
VHHLLLMLGVTAASGSGDTAQGAQGGTLTPRGIQAQPVSAVDLQFTLEVDRAACVITRECIYTMHSNKAFILAVAGRDTCAHNRT